MKNKINKWILIFLLITSFCNAQTNDFINIVDAIIKNPKIDNLVKIKQLKELSNSLDTTVFSENMGYLNHKIGLKYSLEKKYDLAIKFTKKAVLNRQNLKVLNKKKLNRSLYNLYVYSKTIEKINDSKEYLEQIIKNKNNDKYTFKAYRYLGFLYAKNGDYYKALVEFNNLIFFSKENNNKKELLKGHEESIYVYSLMEEYGKNLNQINFHKKAIEKLSENNLHVNVLTNLANIYEEIGLKKEAIVQYEKVLNYYLLENDSVNIGNLFNNIGIIYAKDNNYKKATNYFDKALKITNNNVVNAYTYDNKGYYLQTNNPKDKILYFQKAINCLLFRKDTIQNRLPSIIELKKSQDKIDVLGYLIDLANTWTLVYEKNKNLDALHKSKEILLLIDELVSYIRFESDSEKSKLFWINKGVNTYMLAVKVCYLLNDTKNAFYFMEKNKALLLLENLNTFQSKLAIKIPKIIIDREQYFKLEFLKEEHRLDKKKYYDLKTVHQSFLDSLSENYPKYAKTKKKPQIISLQKSIDKHVSENSNFIEYILNEETGYGIFCSKTKTIFFKINNVPKLLKEIENLKLLCAKSFKYKTDFNNYNVVSFKVFQALFPFKEALKQISNKKLVIVSDFQLINLPFEALTTKINTNLTKNYLINNTEISYLQSSSVLDQIVKKNRISRQNMIGVAPEYFKKDSLMTLQKSVDRMKKIGSFIPSKLLLNDKATKISFLTKMNDYKIIHLNTHAGIDKVNKEPWIAFWDQKLYLQELYEQPNQAELVVLDACKSASGSLEAGEGIMSLSRGFFYNGAKSVISSQWNTNEKTNGEILQNFYAELNKNLTKSTALRNAKLQYLDKYQLSETSPYYWASMKLTGDAGVINPKKVFSYLWFAVFFLIISILLFFIYKRFMTSEK